MCASLLIIRGEHDLGKEIKARLCAPFVRFELLGTSSSEWNHLPKFSKKKKKNSRGIPKFTMAQEGHSPVLVFDSLVMVLHSLVLVFTQSSFNFYTVQFYFVTRSSFNFSTESSSNFYTV